MAALGSQSIASSYEQILHVDADGGGDTTTHVSVKDGDNGTTFGFTIASDALMMSSTNRLEFGDTGTYIHQSADGVLDLVSDTEIEINATTIDINGAVEISGDLTLASSLLIPASTEGIFGSADTNTGIRWEGSDAITIDTGGTERVLISGVNVMIGNTVVNPASGFTDQTGFGVDNVGSMEVSSAGTALNVGRTDAGGDGTLVTFRQAGTSEGSISVSGSTVSYNAFLGSHWSELTDGSFPSIEIGTVVSTIDEILEGHDDRLPKFKVSDSEGDKRVYGVFGWWNYDDIKQEDGSFIKADTPTNASIHSLGAGRIRVTGSCEGGDLLESKGDGTAKVQDDDIIRSKTIGKVSVGNTVSGVNLVPCVLYCG